MCGRFLLTSPVDAMNQMFGTYARANFMPNYNIAPMQPIPVVRMGKGGGPELVVMQWGFIASWMKNPPDRPLINARGETVDEKPSFKAAIRRRRCLVPADGFYEWHRDGAKRQPYAVLPVEGGPIAFAAIWERWHGADGSDVDTVAMLTVPANGAMQPIHHRMPVVVQPEDFSTWLSPYGADNSRLETAARALIHAPGDAFFNIYPVSAKVGAVPNNGPELLDEIVLEDDTPIPPPDQMSLF